MRTTLAVLLVVGGLIAGCQSDQKMANRGDEEYSGTPISRGGPREDWNSIQSDPVCDMTVNPKTAAATEVYGGRIYYFDTVECQRRFHSNPSAYVPGDPYTRPVQEVK